ncbi:MAG: peptidylprolyl isomerase [Planctomycetota bacterium]
MFRLLATVLLPLFTATAVAQEVPGLKVSLSGRSLVPAQSNVELRLVLTADADVEVPAQLVNGLNLTVKCDDQAREGKVQPGKGGAVPLGAGTRIERVLTFPAASFLPSPDHAALASIVVAWDGVPGAAFAFKVAPDTRNVKLENLDLAKTRVVLVTNRGEMTLSFRPDKAPKHVENFVKLCLQGFYDGTKFHRVIRNFMIQGGCPNTKDDSKPELWGTGGPGYTLDLEANDLRHLRGTLSAARTDKPNTAGSGFFLVHKDSPHLDKNYSAFGNLEEGADTLDLIAETPVGTGGTNKDRPFSPVILYSTIVLPVGK